MLFHPPISVISSNGKSWPEKVLLCSLPRTPCRKSNSSPTAWPSSMKANCSPSIRRPLCELEPYLPLWKKRLRGSQAAGFTPRDRRHRNEASPARYFPFLPAGSPDRQHLSQPLHSGGGGSALRRGIVLLRGAVCGFARAT